MNENIQRQRANGAFQPQMDDAPQIASNNSANPVMTPLIASSVGSYVFEAGKQRAQQALNIYSHIDYLRPYFDVEPKDVLNRLLNTFIPSLQNVQNLLTELYGPIMIIFTLSAILIYQMKVANHSVQDGTLIGTAFFVCFSYWIGLSGLLSSSSFVCNSAISFTNFLSLIGYSMFSHCVVLLVGTFIHTNYDHVIFYLMWILVAGAAGLKLALVLFVHTPHPRYKLILAAVAFLSHMMFLIYLHFAYHELAEEVSHILMEKEETESKTMVIQTAAAVTQEVLKAVKREISNATMKI